MMVEKKIYRFDCPGCHNALNARPGDLTFRKFTVGFTCPVCKKGYRILKCKTSITTTYRTRD